MKSYFDCIDVLVMTLTYKTQVPSICSNHIKLASLFHLSGSTRNGERVSMLLQWLLQEVNGQLSCLVGLGFRIKYFQSLSLSDCGLF